MTDEHAIEALTDFIAYEEKHDDEQREAARVALLVLRKSLHNAQNRAHGDHAMILRKKYRFEAAHRLPHVASDHQCGRVHGHGYKVVLECEGPVDPEMGWLFDFHALDAAWAPLHKRLDHHLLNDIDGLDNPTSENLAVWIARRMAPAVERLADGARLVRVEVSETERSLVIFDVPPARGNEASAGETG